MLEGGRMVDEKLKALFSQLMLALMFDSRKSRVTAALFSSATISFRIEGRRRKDVVDVDAALRVSLRTILICNLAPSQSSLTLAGVSSSSLFSVV